MKKTIIAILLALMLIVGLLAVSAFAQDSAVEAHPHDDANYRHCVCGGSAKGTYDHKCEDITWTAIPEGTTDFGSLSTGNYYLTGDLSLTAAGAFDKGEDIKICLNGYNVTSSGRVFGYTWSGSRISVCDCSGVQAEDGSWSWGGTVTGKNANFGAVVYTYSGSEFNVYGGNFTSASPTAKLGAVFTAANDKCGDLDGSGEEDNTDKAMVEGASTLNIYNGSIYYNGDVDNTYGSGAVIGNFGSPYINIHGGIISGAKSSTIDGGAVGYNGNGTLTITGGTIMGGSTTKNGNSVYAKNLVISGGTVTDTVYCAGTLDISGAPVLNEGILINHGKTADAVISGMTLESAEHVKYLRDSDEVRDLYWIEGEGLYIGKYGCKVCGGVYAGCDHAEKVKYTPWTSTNTLPKESKESGNFYLTGTVDLNAQQSMKTNVKVVLDLNGQTVNGPVNLRLYSLHNTGTALTITDTGTDGKLIASGTANDHSLGIWVRYGEFTMYGGTLDASGMTATGSGAGVRVSSGTTFNMYGGTIIGGTGKTGAGIQVESTMNMYGGSIVGGNAPNGATMYVTEKGVVNLNGGQIKGGTASENGGAIYNLGKLDLNGVTVTGGKAAADGGNIYNAGTMVIHDATITGGTATSEGGNLYTTKAVTIHDVDMSGGSAASGGNIQLGAASAHLTVNGGTISGGTVTGNGGNINSFLANVYVNGGTISGGTARSGGNIYLNAAYVVGTNEPVTDEATGATTVTQFAKEHNAAELYMTGGKITLGTATEGNGGNIYANIPSGKLTTTVTAADGTETTSSVTDNLYDDSKLVISGGEISYGKALNTETNGLGGNWFARGIVTVTGGQFLGGQAGVRGANLYCGYLTEISNATITDGDAPSAKSLYLANNTTITDSAVGDLYQNNHKLTLVGNVRISTLYTRNNQATQGIDASQLTCTVPVSVTAAKLGAFADCTMDKSDCFVSGDPMYEVFYDTAAQQLVLRYTQMQDIYVSNSGDDANEGTAEDPVKTLERALQTVKDGGTVHIVDVLDVSDWSAHGKSVTVTGGEMNVTKGNPFYIRDSVHFKGMTIRFSTVTADTDDTAGKHRIYALGNKVIIDQDVTVAYGAPGVTGLYVHLYGGGNSTYIVSSTDLTVLSGTWGRICGGSNGSDISGDVHLTVGGNVNESVDYANHDNSGKYLILGGSSGGNIGGTVYMNVTGGHHTSTHGGSIGSSTKEVTLGGIEMHITGGNAMAFYGGGRGGRNIVTGEANMYFEGGTCEQIFGGGLTDYTGNLNVYLTGGTVTRRVYGGCYNEYEWLGYKTSRVVNGTINLYIGSGADLKLNSNSDRGLFAHSRYTPSYSDAETNRIIFLDQAAYEKYGSKVGNVSGSVLGSSTRAADYICYLGWSADDTADVITCGATQVEDHVNNALDLPAEAVTLTLAEGPYIYSGTALEPAAAVYSDNWSSGKAALTYANNGAEGTATVTMTVNGYSVSKNFEIQTYKAQVGEDLYTSLTDAIANAGEGYVKLLADCTDVLTLDSDLYLDLNGYSLSDVTVSQGHTLYLLDSATDDYQGAYGTAVVSGTVQTLVEANGKTYLVVAEDGKYSAHCYEVKLTHVSLDASNDALGYKAQLFGDEVVMAHVTGFGFDLWVDGGSVKTYSKTGSTTLTLRLKNIMAAGGGEMNINANAFVTFDVSDEKITSPDHTTTMKDAIVAVNALTDLSDAQKAAVYGLYEQYSELMDSWLGENNNIKSWKSGTDAS